MTKMPDTLPGVDAPRYDGPRMPADGGVGGLAQGVAKIGEMLQAKAQLQDRATLIGAASQLRAAETKRLADEGDALTDDQIEGFSDRFAAGFDDTAAAVRAALPGRLQGQFDAETADLKAGLQVRAYDIEHARRTDLQSRVLDGTIDAAGQAVFQDPTQYDQTFAQAAAAIRASGLPQAMQDTRLAKLPNALATQRMLGLVRALPEAAAAELKSGKWADALSPAQVADFEDMAQHQARARDQQAAEDAEPLAETLINQVTSQPGAFTSALNAFAASPSIAALPEDSRAKLVRDVAGRAAEARLLAVAQDNPWAAKSELLSGRHDSYLDPRDKERLLASFSAEIRARADAGARDTRDAAALQRATAQVDLQRRMQDDLQSRAETGKGVAVSVQEVQQAFGSRAAAEFQARQADADAVRQLTAPFASQTPAQIEDALAAAAPQAGQPGYAAAETRYQMAQQIATEELKRRQADPAGAALRNGAVSRAYQWLQADPASAKLRADYLALSRRQQSALGVPTAQQRVLPAAAAAAYAGQLTGAGPNERAGAMRQIVTSLIATWGPDAGRALAEVAALAKDPQLGALAPLASPAALAQSPAALARAADALSRPDPGASVNAANRRTIGAQIDAQFGPLLRSLNASAAGAQAARQVRAAAQHMGAVYMAQGMSAGDAADAAIRPYTDQYNYRAGWRAPKIWAGKPLDPGAVAAGAALLAQRLADEDKVAFPAGDPRLKGKAAAHASAEALRAGAHWATTGDDSGLVLVDDTLGQQLVYKGGGPVYASWDDLLRERQSPYAEQMRRRMLVFP